MERRGAGGASAAEGEAGGIAALRAIADTPFDLARKPAFRVAVARIAADDHILLLLTHHIVSDAWSYGLIFRELSSLYADAARGAPPSLPAPALQFGDFAAWQRETLQGERLCGAPAVSCPRPPRPPGRPPRPQ